MDLSLSKRNARLVTGAALILANLMPLAGVLFMGWDVASLLFAYWLESAVVGFFNVVKMVQAEGSMIPPAILEGIEASPGDLARLATIRRSTEARSGSLGAVVAALQRAAEAKGAEQRGGPAAPAELEHAARAISSAAKIPIVFFFLVHYGMFMAGHAVFLLAFFGMPRLPAAQWLLTTFLLFTSHGLSHMVYFLGREEYRVVTPRDQMARPYGRIVVMHLTIIFGGIALQSLRAPLLMLVLLVGLKILIDLVAHIRSHARYETAASAGGEA